MSRMDDALVDFSELVRQLHGDAVADRVLAGDLDAVPALHA